jgi:hypothetical protein
MKGEDEILTAEYLVTKTCLLCGSQYRTGAKMASWLFQSLSPQKYSKESPSSSSRSSSMPDSSAQSTRILFSITRSSARCSAHQYSRRGQQGRRGRWPGSLYLARTLQRCQVLMLGIVMFFLSYHKSQVYKQKYKNETS